MPLDRRLPLPFDEAWLEAPVVPAEPGAHESCPFECYERIGALTRRTLELIDGENGGSPMHARSHYDGRLKVPDRESWRFGRAEHTLILEGEDELRKRFEVAPDVCGKIKGDGTRCQNAPKLTNGHEWGCGVAGHAPKNAKRVSDFVTEADIRRIRRMHEAVKNHPFARRMGGIGWKELTLVWDVPVRITVRDGDDWKTVEVLLRHRGRLDRLSEPRRGYPFTIVDLKRMPLFGGSRRDRERAIESGELHVQAALYCEGVRATFGLPPDERVDFVWLFVEERFPHDVVPFPASEETLEGGAIVLEQRRRLWALCEHYQTWPGRTGVAALEARAWGKEEPPPAEEPGGLSAHVLRRLGAGKIRKTETGEEYIA